MVCFAAALVPPDGYSFSGFSRCKDVRTIDGRHMKQPIDRDAIGAALHSEKLHSKVALAPCVHCTTALLRAAALTLYARPPASLLAPRRPLRC